MTNTASKLGVGPNALVGVVRTSSGLHVISHSGFLPGDRILVVEGERTACPSRYSVQIDEHTHVEVPGGLDPDSELTLARHPWRALNHACEPNARLAGLDLIAVRPIAPGDEITFDYTSTEYDMSSPFTCRCGRCGGKVIRGFRHLSLTERQALLPYLSEHLRRRLHADLPG